MRTAPGLWSTARFTATSPWLPGRALPWAGAGAPSPHCEGGQGSLAPATNPAGSQTELTTDAQLQVSPRPAKEADAGFSVQLGSSSGPVSCGRG